MQDVFVLSPRQQRSFRMKAGRTMVACAVGGHQRFAEVGVCVSDSGANKRSRGSARFAGQRPCAAKEAFLLS